MGQLKQLLPLGDRPVIRHSIDALRESGIGEIVVVCGADPGMYEGAIENSGVRLVPNRMAASEMADSLRLGLEQIDPSAYSAILICLADHPLVTAETFSTLVGAHRRAPDSIIIPSFQGRRGHPGLFPATIIGEIFTTTSLREIVRRDPERVLVVDVPDEGVVLDVDTEADYRRAVEVYQTRIRERSLRSH
jgi:molybdenum cofactor cytidylyltransferase